MMRRNKSPKEADEAELKKLLEQVQAEGEGTQETETQKLERQLKEYAAQKPGDVAKLLRTWLTEDES
ncbi:MAG: hypothetical protein H0Z38_08180 [Firmicutes bacterium]|nr:hypothetical protein [Bacillota bacterium]